MNTSKIESWEDLILHHTKMTTPSNKKFVTLEGKERSMEEQIVFLSQEVRALKQIVGDQNQELYNLFERVVYLENQ